MEYKKYKVNNMNIYTINTNKFKNAYIEVRFRSDIDDVDAPVRTFLMQLLNTTNNNYKTIRDFNIALEEIYDADIYTSGARTGYIYTSSIGIDFLNPKYIKEDNYLKKVIYMLMACINNPHIKNNKWDESVYQNHIDNFRVYIDRYQEDPIDYTIIESKKKLFAGSIVSQRVVGTKKDIVRITPTSLYEEWYKMLNNSEIEIIVVGELNMDLIVEYIKRSSLKNETANHPERIIVQEELKPYKETIETKYFNQTSMILYFQNEGLTDKEKFFIGPLYRNILGSGGLSDKLGNYLRMKNSLCYAYSCQIVVPDSYMFIGTSLSKENINKAKDCILKAVEEMKRGHISKEELAMHKKKLLNDIKIRQDDIFSLGNNYYNHDLYNVPFYDEYYEIIDNITIEEIIAYAKKWTLTYSFILKERG